MPYRPRQNGQEHRQIDKREREIRGKRQPQRERRQYASLALLANAHRNRNRRQQKPIRQAVAARGHHEIGNQRIIGQTNEDRNLNAQLIRNAPAQNKAGGNVNARTQQRRRTHRENRIPERVRRHPHQERIQNMVIRKGTPDVRCGDKPEISVRFIAGDRLHPRPQDRPEDRKHRRQQRERRGFPNTRSNSLPPLHQLIRATQIDVTSPHSIWSTPE